MVLSVQCPEIVQLTDPTEAVLVEKGVRLFEKYYNELIVTHSINWLLCLN